MRVQAPLAEPLRAHLAALYDQYLIDYATYLCVQLYADSERVSRVLSESDQRQQCSALLDIRDDVLRDIDRPRFVAIVYVALLRYVGVVVNMAEIASAWAYTDSTWGGALEPPKRRPVIRRDGSLTPKVCRRLYSDSWIRRYVSRNGEMRDCRRLYGRLNDHVNEFAYTSDLGNGADLVHDDLEEYSKGIVKVRRVRPENPQITKRAVKRSVVFAASLLSRETVLDFVKGRAIVFPGTSFDLSISLRGTLFSLGHGACKVCVVSKEGQPLVDLCVYFEDTPVVDQVVGFALHMSSGLEEELLQAANISTIHPGGAQHPLIRSRLPISVPTAFEARRAREFEYMEQSAELWKRACLDFVFGASRSAAVQRIFLSGRDQRAPLTDLEFALP